MVTFPKCALSKSVEQIGEFTDSQQLYYYLTWTNKMQAIDGEFIEYTFFGNQQYGKIAIFNAELHDTNSNAILYIVAVLNSRNDYTPFFQWKMNAFMTADEIFNIYGINENDLPIGSREKHNYWKSEIYKQQNQLISLHPNILYISSLHKATFIHSQKYKNSKSYFKKVDNINKAIQESINNIRNNILSLIPILKINTKKEEICCQCLLPIKLQNEPSWIAISYQLTRINNNNNTESIVSGLYIDAQDIINKSLLLSPSAIYKYQFLKGEQTLTINSLQKQLNDALKRESMLLLMLQQKDEIVQSLINNVNNINVYGIPMISTPRNVNNIYPNIMNGQEPVLSNVNSY